MYHVLNPLNYFYKKVFQKTSESSLSFMMAQCGFLSSLTSSSYLLHSSFTSSSQNPQKTQNYISPLATLSQGVTSTSLALPLKEIPGDYGLPLIGPWHDKISYFYQGKEKFFETLVDKYESTVVRVNMPPGPPFFPDPRTIMLLDQKSYPVLFDMSKVEKKDVFTGTYTPSLQFTGGFRVLSYLDPSEKKHAILKSFCFDLITSHGRKWMPEFHRAFMEATTIWEQDLEKKGKADFTTVCGQFSLDFLTRSVMGSDVNIGSKGPTWIEAWLALQLHPQCSFGLPKCIEHIFLHTFPLPYALIAPMHKKLYKFFRNHSGEVLEKAALEFGLDREEACHNLLFFICFNTWGGIQKLFPTMLMWVGEQDESLQREIREEVRKAVGEEGGLSMKALEKMELVSSTIHEVLRIDPPVPFQYGRAKEDMVIESHEAMYKVRKGELLGGYLGMVMRDERVFEKANVFKARRFMGEKGKQLLRHLMWSNGRENEEPSLANKQCPGKNFVNFMAQLFLAQFFLHYDSFKLAPVVRKGTQVLVHFTALQKRTI